MIELMVYKEHLINHFVYHMLISSLFPKHMLNISIDDTIKNLSIGDWIKLIVMILFVIIPPF